MGEMEFTELNLKLYKDIGLCLTALVISCVWLLFVDQIKRRDLGKPTQYWDIYVFSFFLYYIIIIIMGGIWYIMDRILM